MQYFFLISAFSPNLLSARLRPFVPHRIKKGSNKREEEVRKQHLVCIPSVVLFVVQC